MEKASQHFNTRLHGSLPLWLLESRRVWACVLVYISRLAWSRSVLAAGSPVPPHLPASVIPSRSQVGSLDRVQPKPLGSASDTGAFAVSPF